MKKFKITWTLLFFLVILTVHTFFRFFELEKRLQFTWDQVQNAWVMKEIIVDKTYPTTGMVAKLNSPFRIGPLYYYILAPFYFVSGLDPIGAGIFAGSVSILTLIVLYWVARELFSSRVALLTSFLYAVSYRAILMDRIAWPVIFIPMLSALIFLALYKLILGQTKYALLLGLTLGVMFHMHFTAILFPIIVALTMPLWKRNKSMVRSVIASLILFFILITPIAWGFITRVSSVSHTRSFLSIFYHGFHFRRVLQVLPEALIEWESLLLFPQLNLFKYILLPAFFIGVFLRIRKGESVILIYVFALWFLVPLLVFSTYSGEISDYYFSLTRPVAFIIFAWLIWEIIRWRWYPTTVLLVFFLVYYSAVNITTFFKSSYGELPKRREMAKKAIQEGRIIEFQEGVAESYLYYYYTVIRQWKL